MVGALTCLSVLGVYAMLKDTEQQHEADRKRRAAEKWTLPRKRRRRHSPEDYCRHCTGTGTCDECAPDACRICKGTGLQPRDEAIVSRLSMLWDGAA